MKREWTKAKNLKIGSQIAIYDKGVLAWDEVVSVKSVGRERVYDIEVENSHNFVAGHYVNSKTNKALTEQKEQAFVTGERLPRGMERSGILYGGILAHNTYIFGNVGICHFFTNP